MVSFRDEVMLFEPLDWEEDCPPQTIFGEAVSDGPRPSAFANRSQSMPSEPLSLEPMSSLDDPFSALGVDSRASSTVSWSTADVASEIDSICESQGPTAVVFNQGSSAGRDMIRSQSAPLSKGRRPHKRFKKYSAQNPSRYCHICAKKRDGEPSIICHNVQNLLCQKRVCQKCFVKRGWNWEEATVPGSNWLCPHCRGECPKEGRCFVYGRGNRRGDIAVETITPENTLSSPAMNQVFGALKLPPARQDFTGSSDTTRLDRPVVNSEDIDNEVNGFVF